MSDPVIFGVLLAELLILLAAGVWVAVALLAMALTAILCFSHTHAGLVLATTLWGQSHSWPLAALPLFILMGEVLIRSRLSEDMFSGLAPWLGRAPGRLLHVNVLGCAIFAAVSGSSAATAATIGRMSVPELTRRGYPQDLILGTLAGSATLGLLIPPSIILIVYGVATEQIIARLFIAGILPGLMLVVLFAGYVAIRALMDPAAIPVEPGTPTLREKLRATRRLAPVVALIAGVIGSIYTGVASPTDAAAVGVVLSVVLAVATGSFSLERLPRGADVGHPHLVHDRLHPGRRRGADHRHGLHRHPAAPGRLDRHLQLSPYALLAVLTVFFVGDGLLSGRDLDRGADHLDHPADGAGGGHRPFVVRHLSGAGGRDGADHPAGGVQPVRDPGADRRRYPADRPRRAAVLLPAAAGGGADHPVPRHRHPAAIADGLTGCYSAAAARLAWSYCPDIARIVAATSRSASPSMPVRGRARNRHCSRISR